MKLAFQVLYVLLGVGANAVSLAHRLRTGRTLTPVDPRGGLAIMALYAAVVTGSHLSVPGADAVMLGMLLIISYGGVYCHFCRSVDEYASAASRWSAIAINTYGVVVTAAVLVT